MGNGFACRRAAIYPKYIIDRALQAVSFCGFAFCSSGSYSTLCFFKLGRNNYSFYPVLHFFHFFIREINWNLRKVSFPSKVLFFFLRVCEQVNRLRCSDKHDLLTYSVIACNTLSYLLLWGRLSEIPYQLIIGSKHPLHSAQCLLISIYVCRIYAADIVFIYWTRFKAYPSLGVRPTADEVKILIPNLPLKVN